MLNSDDKANLRIRIRMRAISQDCQICVRWISDCVRACEIHNSDIVECTMCLDLNRKWFKWLGKIRTESVDSTLWSLPTAFTFVIRVGNWRVPLVTQAKEVWGQKRPSAIRRISEETKRLFKKFEKLEKIERGSQKKFEERCSLIRLLFWFYGEAFRVLPKRRNFSDGHDSMRLQLLCYLY